MSKEKLSEIESEKQEIKEFIELLKGIPKESRRDIKFIMVGINIMNGKEQQEEHQELVAMK